MASDIKVGDRAVLIKYPCCGKHWLDVILVTEIKKVPQPCTIQCDKCGMVMSFSGTYAVDRTVPQNSTYVVNCPVEWLKPRNTPADETEVTRVKEVATCST